jgi:hypothetical protein
MNRMAATKSAQTNVVRSFARVTALTVVIALPFLGVSGVASAKATKAAKGSAAWCAKHAKRAVCKAGATGGSGGTTGGAPTAITIKADPNPLVETGQSEVHVVLQVSTSPGFAGDAVNIDSSQLDSSCSGPIFPGATNNGSPNGVTFYSLGTPGATPSNPQGFAHSIQVVLDDDGNATVTAVAVDCAPGTSVFEADLEVVPFITALTTLTVSPPNVTAEGVTAFPSSEVETGDTSTSGDSDIYTVFYVETNPVYAEQPVTINSAQLQDRCVLGWLWSPGNMAPSVAQNQFSYSSSTAGAVPETTLDDDGNAVFVFYGVSCATGTSAVIAEVGAGTHPTYTTTFTVNPPAPSGPSVP